MLADEITAIVASEELREEMTRRDFEHRVQVDELKITIMELRRELETEKDEIRQLNSVVLKLSSPFAQRQRGIGEGYVASVGDRIRVTGGTHQGYTGTVDKVNESTVRVVVSPTKVLSMVKHRFLAPVLPRSSSQTLDSIIDGDESKWSALLIVLQKYIAINDENTALICRLQGM
jgi:hypothetical protein